LDGSAGKQKEHKLATERQMLQALMDSKEAAFCPIYFKDRESRFLRYSAGIAALFRLKNADDAIGKTDFDFFGKEHAQQAFDDEQTIIRTGQPIIGKSEKETWPDGRVSWALTSKMPLHDETGTIIGTFGVSQDITAIKLAEAKIEELHKQLLLASRQAGMAEVATSILHNVGNALNSVNVSATLLIDSAMKSKVPSMARAIALLNEHSMDIGGYLTNDPKGKLLPSYLSSLTEQLIKDQERTIAELEGIGKNIEHIKAIVAMQQNYATVLGVVEHASVIDLVEDAVRMNEGALLRHEVALVREYTDVAPIMVDKHKVLQILVNLISNAKYACDATDRKHRQIRLKVSGQDQRVRISVIDNGVGISPENLTRIFSHGFTTSKEGHGFGLQSAALAARELSGSLSVKSEGLGCGSTFELELPVSCADPHHAK
jgi:PAS domain S-box-containing protein